MNKKAIYTFGGTNQDISRGKHMPRYYFEAQHIKILATNAQSTGAAANEKGNELVVTLPSISISEANSEITYGTTILPYDSSNEIATQIADGGLPTSSNAQIIIGHIETRTGLVLWTTDDLGFDCIWHIENILEDDYTLELLYVRDFDFSSSFPIQAVFNYENENIQKVYWVDGQNQIRYVNIRHDAIDGNTPLIDVPINTINLVGNVTYSQPTIINVVGGGSHTSGMIQYAYNLYRQNGSQTKLSPLTDLVALDKGPGLGGGELNEEVSATPVIQIDNIDESYTNLKVYAIKYTSFNELPSIDLIDERLISGGSATIYDDGSTIESLTLEEFLFLGSTPIVPKHIEAKDSRLFLANIQDQAFDLPDELDCRAYSFPISSATTRVWKNPQLNASGDVITAINFVTVPADWSLDLSHPAINVEYDTRKYQQSSTVLGGEGKYVKYEVVQKTEAQLSDSSEELRFLKDNEIYRIGIEFYNSLGQTSPPKWIADFRVPEGNLEGNFNTLKVELTAEFYTWLNTYDFGGVANTPIGYRILRADRTIADRSIVCSGALTQYMVQTDTDPENYNYWKQEPNRRTESDNRTKFPITVSRGFTSNIKPLNKTNHLEMMNELSDYYGSSNSEFPDEEIYSGVSTSYKRAHSWQFTKLFQLHSPEVIFNAGISFGSSLKIRIKGLAKNTKNDIWLKRININNEAEEGSWKEQDVTNLFGNPENSHIKFLALFGPSDDDNEMDFQLINREYKTFVPDSTNNKYPVYGTPEITERGQGVTTYNGDGTLKYSNTMEGFLTDRSDDTPDESAIISMNSYGARCVTIAEGEASETLLARKSMEDMYTESSLADPDGLLIAELVIPDGIIATGNLYGGNSFEDKSRTSYIRIGDYTPIGTNNVQIDNAGDVYVYNFKFTRLAKTETQVLDDQVLQLTEIVEFPIESIVDLKNRNDISLFEWDSEFQPQYDDYIQYNRVYSQQPNLVNAASVDFNFQRIKGFDTRIQASKLKIPNESVDSWTDILDNEVLDLDGKYGSISNIIAWRDTMYAFQDESIAQISINPRIQVQGSDGIGLELGTGGILYDFNYITTNSGAINKWGIVGTKKGIYYYDALNKAIGRVPDATSTFLTDAKGLHNYFNNNYDFSLLKIDNPVLSTGVVSGYDNYNNDVYFTLLQGGLSFTRCYNELIEEFIDIKTYTPSRYINKGEKLLMPNTGNTTLWESYKGDYNSFFGSDEPSYIILQVNPEANVISVFDTIEFNSELYLNDIDQPDKTLTHIQGYNEYQDSGRIPLVVARDNNLRRKFRRWRANIPRDGRSRLRNPWIFLKLELENSTNYRMILHDIIVNYTV